MSKCKHELDIPPNCDVALFERVTCKLCGEYMGTVCTDPSGYKKLVKFPIDKGPFPASDRARDMLELRETFDEITKWTGIKVEGLPEHQRYGVGPVYASLEEARGAIGGVLSPEEMVAADLEATGSMKDS